jgi:hypothetical protein
MKPIPHSVNLELAELFKHPLTRWPNDKHRSAKNHLGFASEETHNKSHDEGMITAIPAWIPFASSLCRFHPEKVMQFPQEVITS